jgi:hypothetical protein
MGRQKKSIRHMMSLFFFFSSSSYSLSYARSYSIPYSRSYSLPYPCTNSIANSIAAHSGISNTFTDTNHRP